MALGPEKRFAMLVDLERCNGCQACVLACKSENQVPVGSFFSWIKTVELGRYPSCQRLFLPSLCNQCDSPSCVQACPVGATFRQADGIVRIDPHRCIGCKYCFWACPYGVRIYDPDTRICRKCEFCVHRLERGLLPACVEACPTGALIFGLLGDPESEITRRLASSRASVLKPQEGSRPQVFYLGMDPALSRPAELRGPQREG